MNTPWLTSAKWRAKTPDERKLIGFDFTGKLPSNNYLTTPLTVSVVPSDLTLGIPVIDRESRPIVYVLVSGGTAGVRYKLRCIVRDISGEVIELEKCLSVSANAALKK